MYFLFLPDLQKTATKLLSDTMIFKSFSVSSTGTSANVGGTENPRVRLNKTTEHNMVSPRWIKWDNRVNFKFILISECT